MNLKATRTRTRNSPLRVLMVAAEASPFAKVGGLGDVTGTLPRRLVELGFEVAVVLPLYRQVLSGGHKPRPTGRKIVLNHAGIDRRSPVHELDAEGVRYWFIREDRFYDRDDVYGPPGGEYPDSAQRFSYLSRAAVEVMKVMDFEADVVHCHDWHTALTPLYLETRGIRGTGNILTIHNLAYQGVFDGMVLDPGDLPAGSRESGLLSDDGHLNFLRAGIVSADVLTTVSPTYAQEILSPEFGCGLENHLKRRSETLAGILNGIDYEDWDPGQDQALAAPFSAADTSGRKANRDALYQQLALSPAADSPLLSFVGRLVHQKGVDVLVSALPAIVKEGFTVIVLGTGDPVLEESLKVAAAPLRGRVSVNIGFDDKLARRIYAGSDFFFMPSRFEPCGLGQMIAMRYGAVPVVRATGGLADTVADLDAEGEKGNGIIFGEVLEGDILRALHRAGEIYHGGRLASIVPRIMKQDNSWRRSARQYAGLYRELTEKERD